MTEVNYTTSNDHQFISAKGDFTKEQLIQMAVEQKVIEKGDFDESEYYQSHFKTVPASANSGYSSWNHPINKPCKGSYFASVLQK